MSGLEPFLPLLTAGAAAGATVAGATFLRPKTPKPQPTARMPDPQSPEVLEARRRKIAEQQARGGRESTILSDDDAYSNSFLGE